MTNILISPKKNLVRLEFIVCFLLFVTTLFVYLPVAHHDFINYDDFEYVVENRHVNHGFTADGIRWAFFSFHVSNWHPVTWLSHMLDCQLYGLDPGKHHITNLFFHILNTILLFFIFFRTTSQLWPSALLAAFFALHPMHVESVAWIAERKDVLSTFFMMITFLLYLSWVKSQNRMKYWAALVFFAFGLMSKPMIVTLPFQLLLFDYWPLQRFGFRKDGKIMPSVCKTMSAIVIEKSPFFVLSGVSSYITVMAQGHGGAIGTRDVYPLYLRFFNSVISYFEYIKKMICPLKLAISYPYPEQISLFHVVLPLFVLTLISLLTIYAAKKKPFMIVGWFWYMGALLPVIGLVQVGTQAMADRYTYIPYIGLFIIILWLSDDLRSKNWSLKRALNVVFSGIIIIMAFLTSSQIKIWSDSITLFQHAIKVTSNNYIAHSNLGQAVMEKKDIPLEKAAEHFEEAIRIKPDFAFAHLNLGVCQSAAGEYEKALASYFKSVQLKPDYAAAYCNIGNIYFRKGQYNEAVDYFRKSFESNPDYGQAYNGLGAVYAKIGDTDKALNFFEKALLLMPDDVSAKTNYVNVMKLKAQKSHF